MTHDRDHTGHDAAAHDHGSHEHHHHEPPAGATNLVTCPVMPGNQVDPASPEQPRRLRAAPATRPGVCCAECGPLFDADPARYAHAA